LTILKVVLQTTFLDAVFSLVMRKQLFQKHIVYAFLSLTLPALFLLATLTYQWLAYSGFWQSIARDESNAAATMMIRGEIAQLILFTMIGCIAGIILAVISLWLQRRFLSLGLAALIFNGLAFLFLVFWII
jgi:hypothetical protein